eukprot:scaffold3065_cov389-Prasinococcus_capsulatus_cf.AAC.20
MGVIARDPARRGETASTGFGLCGRRSGFMKGSIPIGDGAAALGSLGRARRWRRSRAAPPPFLEERCRSQIDGLTVAPRPATIEGSK